MQDTTPLAKARQLLDSLRQLTDQLRAIEEDKARHRDHRRAYMKKYRKEQAARKQRELE